MDYARLTPQTRPQRLTNVLVFLAGSIIVRAQNECIATAFGGAGKIVIAPSFIATNIDAADSPSSTSIIRNNVGNALTSLGNSLANVAVGTLSATSMEATNGGQFSTRKARCESGLAVGGRIRTVAIGSMAWIPICRSDSPRHQSLRLLPAAIVLTTGDEVANKVIDGTKFSIKEPEVIRCFPGDVAVREIATKFDHDAKTISTQRATAFHKAGATFDIELFELKYVLKMP